MKILITVSTYYPKNDGVQNVTQYLAEGLVTKGHEVTVITTNKDEQINSEIHNGVKIERVNLYTKYGFYFGDKKAYVNLIEKESGKSDVMINVCTQNAFTDVILKKIRKFKCKKILYMHGMFDFHFHKLDFMSFTSIANKFWKELRWWIYYNLNGKYFKQYDLVTQLHEKDYANEFFKRKYGINSAIIENAANDDFFEKQTKKEFTKPFNKYLIYVANYDDGKNQKLAIIEFLKSNIDNDIGLILIGSKKNSYYTKMEKLIKKSRKKYNLLEGEKPILMLYSIDRDLISSYISNAYLYIMTSRREIYPISIVEAMASGIPFICTDVGIVKYLSGGIVTDKKNMGYWIKKMVNNDYIRNEMSKLCVTYARENFRIKNKIEMLENYLIL